MDYRINTDSSKVSEKISEAYSNLESMRIAINNLKKANSSLGVKSPSRFNPEGESNTFRVQSSDLPEKPSKPNILAANLKLTKTNSNIYVGNPENTNINTNYNSYYNNNYTKTGNFSNNNNFNLNTSKTTHNVINQMTSPSNLLLNIVLNRTGLLNERLNSLSKQNDLNISTSSIHNFKTLDNLEKEFEFLKEEYEGTIVTNKILNKSNLELKTHIKMLENELTQKEEENKKISDLNRTIEDLKSTIGNNHKLQQDSKDIIQSLKQMNNDINQEIGQVKASYEELKNDYSVLENENEELKKIIDNNEINTKNMNEKIVDFREKMCK